MELSMSSANKDEQILKEQILKIEEQILKSGAGKNPRFTFSMHIRYS